MTDKDPRTPRVDPREPLWLSAVTILFCLGEGALITIVLMDFRADLFALASWLADRTRDLSVMSVEGWGIPLVTDSLWGVSMPVGLEQVWLAVVVSATVFTLLGVLVSARKATRGLLEATYTSSGPFRRRKADTLARLDHMLP